MKTTDRSAHMLRLKTLPLAVALASITPFTAMHANASAMMEEVIVTAQKREESVQDVPIAITAFSGDAIQEMGATNVSDLGKATAGVEMNNKAHCSLPTIFAAFRLLTLPLVLIRQSLFMSTVYTPLAVRAQKCPSPMLSG